LEDTAAASGLDANAATDAENCEPFCSSSIRLLFGVEELKKAFQLVVISETVAEDPPDDAADDAGAAADDAGAAADDAGALDEEEELEPLEQADMAAMSTRPSAGAK
jgi:hypothetical protein